ncbi:hypothetical protein [Streptomyces aureocirculatus]|uniref:hypothetical protein n=1 Tax=Streptomyces aureocirculatus TaxID=67275 RepID=UPI0004CC6AFB|nr:hypothetical protein [Streptomyces aureocirculatus]
MTKDEYCWTCDAHEPHRKLDGPEQSWLKKRLGRVSVNEFLVCLAPNCRNLRTGSNKKPFPEAVRLPDRG